MRSVAIILGDNDFGCMFRNLLETMVNVFIYYSGTNDLTEDIVKLLIREGLRFHYLAYQIRFDVTPEKLTDEVETARILDYLLTGFRNTDNLRILFDNEADKAFQTEDHDGGAWPLDIKSGQVNSF